MIKPIQPLSPIDLFNQPKVGNVDDVLMKNMEMEQYSVPQPMMNQEPLTNATPIQSQPHKYEVPGQSYQKGLTITQRFGNPNARLYGRDRRGRANINRGVDISKAPGQPQMAPGEGKWVVQSVYTGNDFNTGWGRSVVIKNLDTGETIRRSHLDKVYATPGQVVTGKPLGTTGRTGRTTGFHADVEYTDPKGRLSDYTKSRYIKYEG
jgi:murein DD-endopeptidase MepM/ murein hydrolase activator NlpD